MKLLITAVGKRVTNKILKKTIYRDRCRLLDACACIISC